MSAATPRVETPTAELPVVRAAVPPDGAPVGAHDVVVVANRLPVERDADGGWRTSPGGLVRALLPTLRDRRGVWVGWTGAPDDDTGSFSDEGIDLSAVRLDAEQIRCHYESVSNGAFWPLYHDAIRPSNYDNDSWAVHREVNRAFAERAAAEAAPGAVVWVHDYHLQLVPAMLRELRPDLRIGFFLHIPFPPQELFMRLPWRDEVLAGLLGADLVGFQRTVAAENFAGLAARLLGLETRDGRVLTPDGRAVRVEAHPISIDVDEIEGLSARDETTWAVADIRARLGNPDVVLLGVDRLDYTKGIEERLAAFGALLDRRAEGRSARRPDVVLVQIAVPSRENVDDYQAQRDRVERLVGSINGEHATLGYPAVHYLHQGFPLADLVSLYRAADVMVVTPLRDGMNLVAKEFVAARIDGRGTLVLSEFAGAVDELTDAVIVNPHDPEALVAALETAIAIEPAEAATRMAALRAAVAANDVHHWAGRFLAALGVG